jgi:hypothetical protein
MSAPASAPRRRELLAARARRAARIRRRVFAATIAAFALAWAVIAFDGSMGAATTASTKAATTSSSSGGTSSSSGTTSAAGSENSSSGDLSGAVTTSQS